ncbi:MAG: hypothetical protein K2O91_18675, partial [Lachnospiraceae bacterium]|nr:hypothetical protein [Lachnospiraceae bacterium]
ILLLFPQKSLFPALFSANYFFLSRLYNIPPLFPFWKIFLTFFKIFSSFFPLPYLYLIDQLFIVADPLFFDN